MRNLIDEMKKEIKDWRKVAESKETPKLPGEGFEAGWRLAINRVCNSIDNIIIAFLDDEINKNEKWR